MRWLAPVAALFIVACAQKDEAHVTITAGASLDAPTIASIRTLEFAVLGDQPANIRYGISGELADRKTTWIYRATTNAHLAFEVVARDATEHVVASGKSAVVHVGSSPVAAHVVLETTTPPNPDKSRLGETCTLGVDTCASGFCVDGVCCSTACTGTCMTCNGTSPGTCAPEVTGTDPDGDCAADGTNPCGLDGSCDGAGGCRKARAGTACGAAACTSGAFTGASFCDGGGTCIVPTPRTCAPYGCNLEGNDCATICASSADCAAPATCGSSTNTVNPPGSCGAIPLGNHCATDAQCAMGACIDGVCCSATSACGTCQSCAVPGHEGACSPILAGVADPHGACTNTGDSSCGTTGTCDGAGACSIYPAGTVCAPAACSSDGTSYLPASTCKGDGTTCPVPTPTSCGAYICTTSDGPAGCAEACGTCSFTNDPTQVPPLTASCASGKACVDDCLTGTSWACQ